MRDILQLSSTRSKLLSQASKPSRNISETLKPNRSASKETRHLWLVRRRSSSSPLATRLRPCHPHRLSCQKGSLPWPPRSLSWLGSIRSQAFQHRSDLVAFRLGLLQFAVLPPSPLSSEKTTKPPGICASSRLLEPRQHKQIHTSPTHLSFVATSCSSGIRST